MESHPARVHCRHATAASYDRIAAGPVDGAVSASASRGHSAKRSINFSINMPTFRGVQGPGGRTTWISIGNGA
jgi:hypothetical protein